MDSDESVHSGSEFYYPEEEFGEDTVPQLERQEPWKTFLLTSSTFSQLAVNIKSYCRLKIEFSL